jgi:hypothetical protein
MPTPQNVSVERRTPFSLVAQGAAVVAVVAVWIVGVVLVGAGGQNDSFDGTWSAPVLRVLTAVAGLAGVLAAARCANVARLGGRVSASRFMGSAVPVSLANGVVALLPDRPEVAIASFAMTGVLLSWGLWWWHEVRRSRFAMLGLAAAAHGAGMLWPGWSGASGRLLAAISFAAYLVITSRDIMRSVAAERRTRESGHAVESGGPAVGVVDTVDTSTPTSETSSPTTA